jgi:aldose 1-epimerase
MQVSVITYGAIVTSVLVPDRRGELGDVVLGYAALEPYLGDHPYFGAVVGRYCNRIRNASFRLNEKLYELAKNEGAKHLHGGRSGFDRKLWRVHATAAHRGASIELRYTSPDGEEHYTGTLKVAVIYTLSDDNALWIEYRAVTDQDTIVNLTQHSYFNLADGGQSDILYHEVMLNASQFTPIDADLIPTGELRSVAGTPFDFSEPVAIGARIDAEDEQLAHGHGYDHNWVVAGTFGQLRLAARVHEPVSGRVLDMLTTEPGVQFYTGNALDGTLSGKNGSVYKRRHGFSLEAQRFPDSPNQPAFPSTVLRTGETYRQTTVYKFSAR